MSTKICDCCGQLVIDACEYDPSCRRVADFEAWFGKGFLRKLRVCTEHLKESRGWKEAVARGEDPLALIEDDEECPETSALSARAAIGR